MDLATGDCGRFRSEGVKEILEVHCSTYNATAVPVDISECNNYTIQYNAYSKFFVIWS